MSFLGRSFFAKALGLIVLLAHTHVFPQVITELKVGSKVEDFADFKMRRVFGSDLVLRIPLIKGPWEVVYIGTTMSTGTNPSSGTEVAFHRIEKMQVHSLIKFTVFPNDNKSWNPGENMCFSDLISRERGGSINGYCHSLKIGSFMSNPKSNWQGKVRERWAAEGINRPSATLNFEGFYEYRGRFTVYYYHSITSSAFPIFDGLNGDAITLANVRAWWAENNKEPRAARTRSWYEAHSTNLASSVEKPDPANIYGPIQEEVIDDLGYILASAKGVAVNRDAPR